MTTARSSREIIRQAVDRGGKIIIPSFAIAGSRSCLLC